jgi:hypothetical protein
MEAAGGAAFPGGSVDAKLAALTLDSARDARACVHESAASPRTLVFQGAQMSVELERTDAGPSGQLAPPDHGDVTLWSPDGRLTAVSADELRCSQLDVSSGGLIRLRCGTPLWTS